MQKTSLVRTSDYFRKQYYAFRNQLGYKRLVHWKNLYECVCDIDIVEQYKACCPCHFHYRQSCYPYHFIFSSRLDMSVLSTSFKFGRLSNIPLRLKISL